MPTTETETISPEVLQKLQELPPIPLEVSADIRDIGPETAQEWLRRNVHNRPVKGNLVRKYVQDMTNGTWPMTGEAVKFSTQGVLLDGQHRLLAICQTGATVPCLVVFGIDPDAQKHMDTGGKRLLSDQLSLAGYQNTTTLAAAARLALAWSTDRLGVARYLSDAEMRRFVDQNPSLVVTTDLATKLKHKGLDLPPSAVASMVWRLMDLGYPLDAIERWLTDLAEMRTTGPGDPKHTLLLRLSVARRSREKLSQDTCLSFLVRTWNAEVTNGRLKKLPAMRGTDAVTVPRIVVTR